MINAYKEISTTVLEVSSKRIESEILYSHEIEYNTYDFMKRVVDIFLSLIGLILLVPLFIIIAFAIKFESKGGSVFYSQDRVGIDGKVFKMYKFRSMIPNADDLLGSLQIKKRSFWEYV
ncbi:sugar transferase [Exiguobacterium alkaliphilum]|uniref:sugar transferase n=1 Tax=Exiguobacterium alkaliphilum TaxID=1428684 RepID=UPI0030843CD0